MDVPQGLNIDSFDSLVRLLDPALIYPYFLSVCARFPPVSYIPLHQASQSIVCVDFIYGEMLIIFCMCSSSLETIPACC
jgi:hypothetical protein